MMPHQTNQVFLAYSHRDNKLRDKLAVHLTTLQKQRIIDSWDDRSLEPGIEKIGTIQQKINTADIILLLVSADFLNEQWDQQISLAMERHAAGQATIIPVILRKCDWDFAPFGHLVPLPRNGQAVTSWDDQDAAFAEIAAGIRQAVLKDQTTSNDNEVTDRLSPGQLIKRVAPLKLLRYGMMAALPIILIRFLGFLEPWELTAYDQMMRLRLNAETDDRLLIVTIDEADRVNWADSAERLQPGNSSLPEPAIEQLLETLQTRYAPAAIGLDIYRPEATDPAFSNLKEQLATNENLFVICKVTDPSNPDTQEHPAPPEVRPSRQGFSDFVIDDASSMVRRQLFYIPEDVMPDESPCRTPFSLSFRLATHFLNTVPQIDHTVRVKGVTLSPLSSFAGAYQSRYAAEHQVLLDYRAPQGDPNEIARRISLTKVLENRLSAEDLADLQNRIVLIGVVDRTREDYWRTPVTDRKVRGLIIHAQMVSHLLRVLTGEQRLIWVWHWSIDWVWIAAWGVLGAAVGWYIQRWQPVLIVGAIAASSLLALCIIIFYGLQGWIPLLPAGFSLIMAIMLAHSRKHTKSSKS